MPNDKPEAAEHLRRLTDMDDFEIAEDDPDVRGWGVLGAEGQEIGEVKDLLVDPALLKVRCLDVELDKDALKLNDERHVLIPLASARLDEKKKKVLSVMSAQEASRLPPYTGGLSAQEYDKSFHTAALRTAPKSQESDMRLTRSAEELKIGKRQVRSGEITVGKHIESEHVNQPVTRTSEVVTVERRPIEGQSGSEAAIGKGGEIRVPVMEEELVVEKRPVAKEELVISKATEDETVNVEADLRKERFDIKEDGRVRHSDDKPMPKRNPGER